MTKTSPVKTSAKKNSRKSPAEVLHGSTWVKNQWEAAQGLLKGRGPKNPVAWQKKLRREWRSSLSKR